MAAHARKCIKARPTGRLIAKVKNNPRIHIPIFGNGDIDTPEKALEYKNRYGVDGIMIGRAAIGYPWIFNEIKHFVETGEHLPAPTIEERIDVCRKHLYKSVEWKGPWWASLKCAGIMPITLKACPILKNTATGWWYCLQ